LWVFELVDVYFDVLHFILILLELGVGFLLGVEVREDLVIDAQLEGLSLLDDVEGEAIEVERVLEGDICGEFVLEEDLAIDCDFDLAGEEGEVEDDRVGLVPQCDFPAVALLAALDVLAYLLHVETQGLDLLHLN
jgi:hypothetical protein